MGSRGCKGLPYKRQPLLRCPVTGFLFHLYDGKWRDGRLVHPDGFDDLGYGESGRRTTSMGLTPIPKRLKRFFPPI